MSGEEFVKDFCSEGELTPIDVVSEITGLTYEEIRKTGSVICIIDQNIVQYNPYEERC